MSARIAMLVLTSLLAAAVHADEDDRGQARAPLVVTQGTVVRNVTVVDTRDGSLARGMSVVIDGGKIQKVTARPVRVRGAAQSVNGAGKYVVPGFNDMHTHAMVAVDQTPPYWPEMIANGITGIREMAGSAAVIQRVRQLNADSAAGHVDAPEVLQIASDIFVGLSASVPPAPASAADAVKFVQQEKALGADFIKTTAGNAPSILALLAEARNDGLYVAGHLTPALSALDSSNAGWHSIEHLGAGWGLLMDCSTQEKALRDSYNGGAGTHLVLTPMAVINPRAYDAALNAPLFYQPIIDTYSEDKCESLASAFVKNESWQVPTLIRLRTQDWGNDPVYSQSPLLAYVDKTRLALWTLVAQQFATLPPSAVETLHRFYALQKKVTRMLKRKGGKMLAGSDLGGGWVVPGFSLHQEFHELAESGLTPLEILQMTTLNAAEFLGRESTMGTVEAGRNADLVLLDRNPVENVDHLDDIAGVFLKGKYFSRNDLQKMLADVATAYGNQPLSDPESALDPNHKD